MRKKSFVAIALTVIAALIGLLVQHLAFAKTAPGYRFATIRRGNIESNVSATGTLSAVTTVSVGTQVSGQVLQLFADYNQHVTKGQLLARIDPTLAQQAVSDADASLEKAQAQELQAQRDFARNQQLLHDGLVARADYDTSQSGLAVAHADVKSAMVALDKAKQNLAYTNIYAPIDGVVVDRSVQQGQTVAASLSAPQLFLIANDLSQMQILAQVGESDIAQIHQGQAVNFTVPALPNDTFHGVVQQVRLQSTTTDNVVDYTVVIAVDNHAGKLMPGMTARVDFLTASARNVLEVSNAALRFHPASTAAATPAQTSTAQHARGQRRSAAQQQHTLYFLDGSGKIAAANVRAGITDGIMTEVEGQGIHEGMQVISGSDAPAQTAQASAPLGGNAQRGPRGGF